MDIKLTLDEICETYNSSDDEDVIIDLVGESDSDDDIDIDDAELDGILSDSDSMDEFIEYDSPDEHTKNEVRKIIEQISKPRLVMGPDGPMMADSDQEVPAIPEDIRNADDDTYILWILKNRMGKDMTLEKYADYISKKSNNDNEPCDSTSDINVDKKDAMDIETTNETSKETSKETNDTIDTVDTVNVVSNNKRTDEKKDNNKTRKTKKRRTK